MRAWTSSGDVPVTPETDITRLHLSCDRCRARRALRVPTSTAPRSDSVQTDSSASVDAGRMTNALDLSARDRRVDPGGLALGGASSVSAGRSRPAPPIASTGTARSMK